MGKGGFYCQILEVYDMWAKDKERVAAKALEYQKSLKGHSVILEPEIKEMLPLYWERTYSC